jgi:hypothetical protein
MFFQMNQESLMKNNLVIRLTSKKKEPIKLWGVER